MQAKGWTPAETKHSGHRRARWHDYALPGIYMLTLATEGRQPVFGKIAGQTRAARGTADYPHLQLSEFGNTVLEEEVPKITKYYKMIEVWKVILMPDHIHMLICVREPLPEGRHLGHVVSGFKAGCSQAWWRWQDEQQAALGGARGNALGGARGSALGEARGNALGEARGSALGGARGSALGRPFGHSNAHESSDAGGRLIGDSDAGGRPIGDSDAGAPLSSASCVACVTVPEGSPEGNTARRPVLFEPGYHDRIVRNADMLGNIRRYMDDNPFRARLRAEIPHLMQRRLHLWIHDREYAAFGNLFLLKNPEKQQVFFHRKNSAGIDTHLTQEYTAERDRLLRLAEEGTVLVTPGISKGEQGVVAAALSRHLPLIILQKEPISEFWKPAQSRFYACAAGHLLILAPWQLDGDSDYARFHNLNDLARDICRATDTRLLSLS